PDGRKGKSARGHEESRGSHSARIRRRHSERRGSLGVGKAGWLSGDSQGLGRRRRTGNASDSQRRGVTQAISGSALGGGGGLWERRPVYGKVHRASSPY